MTVSNKLNFLLLIALVFSVSLGCNLLDSSNGDEAANNSAETEEASTQDESAEEEDSEASEKEEAEKDKPAAKPVGSDSTTVKFARGKTSRKYSDQVDQDEARTYTLSASKGQTMTVDIDAANGNAVFEVKAPGGASLGSKIKSFNKELPGSGAYKIVVTSTGGGAPYEIDFGVSAKEAPKKTGGGKTRTVRFGKGASSAGYSNQIAKGAKDTYILAASAGQVMNASLEIVGGVNCCSLTVKGPSGITLASNTPSTQISLPSNGKYRIIVDSSVNASYKVNFSVK